MNGAGEDVSALIYGLQIVKYVDVATLIYRICDYIQTVDLEIKYLWRGHKRWSLFKIVYLMARYQGFFDQPLLILFYHVKGLSPTTCRVLFGAGYASAGMGGVAGEVLTFLRVYVLAGCTKKMGWYLTGQFMVSVILIGASAAVYLASVVFAPSPSSEHIGCYLESSHSFWLAMIFVWTLLHQAVVLALALWFGLASFRHSSSPLLSIFYRDGTLYLMVLVAAATANIIVIAVAQPVYHTLLILPQAALHSMLSTRIILKMRETATRSVLHMQMSRSMDEADAATHLEFASPQTLTARQREFLSRDGRAFSQHIDALQAPRDFSDEASTVEPNAIR